MAPPSVTMSCMEIIYLGHSSFCIKTKTSSIVTDPFDPQMVGFRFPKTEAQIVTISHPHDDHNKSGLVEGNPKVITGPGEYEINGISMIGIPSFHDKKNGAERGKNTIFVFEIEGIRIAHLGDLGHELTEATVEDMGEIDVLMIPVGGVYTLDNKEAVEEVRSIEPKIIIPMHYKVPGINPEAFGELQTEEGFVSELGLTVNHEKKLSVKADTLPTDAQVVTVLSIV